MSAYKTGRAQTGTERGMSHVTVAGADEQCSAFTTSTTAIHNAACKNYANLIRVLMEKTTSPAAKRISHRDIARSYLPNHEEIVRMIWITNFTYRTMLEIAAAEGHEAMVRLL